MIGSSTLPPDKYFINNRVVLYYMYKKVSVAVLLLLLAVPMAFAAVNVERTSATSTEENVPLSVAIAIKPNMATAGFDLYEFAPGGWDIVSWDVEGYSKTNVF